MKHLCFVGASVLLFQAGPSVSATAPDSKMAVAAQGMVIRGDQEAPLVLYIVPWQEAKPGAAPEVPLIPLLPKVLDHQRGIVDDPAYRLPAAIIDKK